MLDLSLRLHEHLGEHTDDLIFAGNLISQLHDDGIGVHARDYRVWNEGRKGRLKNLEVM